MLRYNIQDTLEYKPRREGDGGNLIASSHPHPHQRSTVSSPKLSKLKRLSMNLKPAYWRRGSEPSLPINHSISENNSSSGSSGSPSKYKEKDRESKTGGSNLSHHLNHNQNQSQLESPNSSSSYGSTNSSSIKNSDEWMAGKRECLARGHDQGTS